MSEILMADITDIHKPYCGDHNTSAPTSRGANINRDDWLSAIMTSSDVLGIAQHLALVIYHLVDPETNSATLSARDLERITGWGRTAIIEHLDKISPYVRVRWGQGRAKSVFELHGGGNAA